MVCREVGRSFRTNRCLGVGAGYLGLTFSV